MADAYRQRLARQLVEALDDWQATRDRLAGNAPALAVLDLCKPYDYDGPACSHCRERMPGDGEVPVAWPCEVYEAVRDAGRETSGGAWTCACRYMNSGPICTHCGKLKPGTETATVAGPASPGDLP